MKFALNQNIEIISQVRSAAVEHALDDLRRDIQNTCEPTADPGIQLLLEQEALGDECFLLIAVKEKNQLKLCAGSDLGFVYGIYEISRERSRLCVRDLRDQQEHPRGDGLLVLE